jgi:hypothetical protein
MSKHTIVVLGGRRLVIQKSKTSVDAVHFELLGADRQSLATFSVGLADVGVVMLALEGVAQRLERERDAVACCGSSGHCGLSYGCVSVSTRSLEVL